MALLRCRSIILYRTFATTRGKGFFFFQAEDGIRDHCVTGVKTCALPISRAPAATGRAAATRTTLEPGRAKENGLAGGSARRCSQAGRTLPANRALRRGEPVRRRSARRDTRGEPAAPGWPPSWARRP